jgi:NTE family protein
MEGDPKAAVEAVEQDRTTRNRGIGLCLSGGGFRATLFHLGAIQRLFELGIATRPDFDTITSVSGGSITAAQWAIAEAQAATNENRTLDFTRDIARPLQALASRDLRTGAMAKKFLLPWNWFRGAFVIDAMIDKFEEAFGKGTLNLLPDHPRFVFCGTDMAFGANFIFERDRVGSYLAGYAPPEGFTLAQAVAASACFPPPFGPLRIDRAAERFKGGRAKGVSADERKQILEDLRVTDGGVYDNMGLEPVWKSHRVVLVSDAGGLMDAEADKNFFWRIQRYQSIQDTQARALRKRFLISGYTQGTINGAYFGVASSPTHYPGARDPGYSKTFAMDVIRNIRTDLDAFSEVEQAVLMNHGYTLVDAAVRTHAPELIATDAAFAVPFPSFATPAVEEDELRQRLTGSQSRKLRGRS